MTGRSRRWGIELRELPMRRIVVVVLCIATGARAQNAPPYVPTAVVWERRTPEQVGMDAAKIQDAIAFARQSEVKAPRALETAHYQTFGREPFGNAVGPMKARGEP